ncbi:MAG: molybdopterin-dependent oxidoreductase [Bryobacteraceae bacterium]|nr:molybdopterin-dependent oxidoreductase [Bryobacteraceae bacterium]
METTRRNIFRFAAGASAGVFFTPAPWKLLDDVSVWSQNWSWIARPLRGEITEKFTACTLCGAGCGIRARCVADQPCRLTGLAGDPASGRTRLCPAGIGAHQLPYAPSRLRTASINGKPATIDEAVVEVMARVKSANRVAVLDGRPGRCASDIYRAVAASDKKWHYVVAPGSTGLMAEMSRLTGVAWGLDTERVKTVLSFGAPVLHGWEMPGKLLERRADYRLIQVEPVQSRTAAFADTWLAVPPHTEGVIAGAIANVMFRDGLVSCDAAAGYRNVVASLTPERAAEISGVPVARIEETARAFASGGPAIALGPVEAGTLGREGAIAVAALNLLIGDRAAVVARGPLVLNAEFADIEEGSVDVLLIDGAAPLPPSLVRRKLRAGACVVALSAFPDEWTTLASIVVPAPAWMEFREDVTGSPDAVRNSFRLAAALVKPAVDRTITPADFVARAAGVDKTVAAEMDARIAAIHARRVGEVYKAGDGSRVELASLSADDFKAALNDGAVWVGPLEKKVRTGAVKWPSDAATFARALVPESTGDGLMLAVRSGMPPVPLLGKLYQESELYAAAGIVRMNPVAGMAEGTRVELRNAFGSGNASVRLDASLPAGVMQASNDAALKLCGAGSDAWRMAAVNVRRAS